MRALLTRDFALAALAALVALLGTFPADSAAASSPGLLTGLGGNVERAFTGYRLGLQLAGVASTPVLIFAGADASLHRSFASGGADAWSDPAVFVGALLPPTLGAGLYLVARLRDDDGLLRASLAAMQAGLLALSYDTVLKLLSGRPAPGTDPAVDVDRQSRTFHPGFGREGIVDGWPSGHTIVTAAVGSSLAAYYDLPLVWAAAAGATTYVALGMTAATGGTQHWFSDTVAGALMGYAIGSSVGEGFRRGDASTATAPATARRDPRWRVSPFAGGGAVAGLGVFRTLD